jgi:peptidoglycan hydrolase-like protein with peptidoglycan-binding domain
MQTLRLQAGSPDKQEIAELQTALKRLGLEVSAEEAQAGELGVSTRDALRRFQRSRGMPVSGRLTRATVGRLNQELEHAHFVGSKVRTATIQEQLERLGFALDPQERKQRIFGESTARAFAEFGAGAGGDGSLVTANAVERLEQQALTSRLGSKTQVGRFQRVLLRAARIAKLELHIDPLELKSKALGPTTKAAVAAFQERYGLEATGEIDPATMGRTQSVADSRPAPVQTLEAPAPEDLAPISRALRLNMTNQHVGDLQKALASMGHPIAEKEFKTRTFGRTTREAVVAYQLASDLTVTGHADGETLVSLNQAITAINPEVVPTGFPHRVRGSVRDELWRGRGGVRVQLREKLIRSSGAVLAERPTQANGFYDVPYDPPLDATGQVKAPFHLEISVLAASEVLDRKVVFNPTQIVWVNFTAGDEPYRGMSEFEQRMRAVTRALGDIDITDIVETPSAREVSHLATETGLTRDDVMRLVLAHRAEADLAQAPLGAAVFYAFLRQNLPAYLPGDLLANTEDWAAVDTLVDAAVTGIGFTDPDLQRMAFENAVAENLVPIAVGRNREKILAALGGLRERFALEKAILVGDGNLKALLDTSTVQEQHYPAVAAAFLKHGNLGASFWEDASSRAAEFGGEAAVADLRTTVDLGEMTRNHPASLAFLKQRIADQAVPDLRSSRDLAKLSHSQWVSLIQENGNAVPPDVTGATLQQRVASYAGILSAQAERLYPSVAVAAAISRSTPHSLTKVAEIQALLDSEPTLDLRRTNLDRFAAARSDEIDEEVANELKAVQRVYRITASAATSSVLLEQGVHSASQVLAQGREVFVATLEGAGVEPATALTIYGRAESQHAHALARLSDLSADLHRTDPQVVAPQTLSPQEQEEHFGDVPALKVLFGSLDACECRHCQSVYGPAAYLTDLLRFLGERPSEQTGRTVRDVLFQRRPDLGNIKLNCDNTDTPVPYIDLVCEVLEALVPAPVPDQDTNFQTTRPAEELAAFPENVRAAAYEVLKDATAPIDTAFNLWQEETRIYLRHLGVPRHELMEAFAPSSSPSPFEVSIAGEFWGISTKETALVTSPAANSAAQSAFWDFDTTAGSVSVSVFLDRSGLAYGELLELLGVRWLNPAGTTDRMMIERPVDTCSTDQQRLVNLTVARLDRMHRFLRLWRHTPWSMWELDLLLRASRLGASALDGTALVHLMRVRRLQERLLLDPEGLTALFGELNTETRALPGDPPKELPSLYVRLFQNRVITTPLDPAFALPLATGQLAEHRSTLTAALAVSDDALGQLLDRTDRALTVANLTKLFSHVAVARGLGLSVPDLLTLLDLTGAADVFADPARLLGLIEHHRWITASGWQIAELDYLLSDRSESPHGPSDETVAQQISSLRESLRTSPAVQQDGQIVSHVAGTFSLTDEQSRLLLTRVSLGRPLVEELAAPALTAVDATGAYATPITPAALPELFAAHRLLHKAALLVRRQRIATADLAWLLEHHDLIGALSFADLPVGSGAEPALFRPWLALTKLLVAKASIPQRDGASLLDVLGLAADPAVAVADLEAVIASVTGWSAGDLAAMRTGLGLVHGPDSDYTVVDTYLRLARCFEVGKRLGVEISLPLAWARRDDDSDGRQLAAAHQTRHAAKAKHDDAGWLSVSRSLHDELRHRKRDSLVRYLVERSQRTEPETISFGGKQFANPAHWRNTSDLLGYVLMDVEMGACQPTSRVKQAISSVQMFVQRCFLNLELPFVEVSRGERENTNDLNSWSQWRWMKSYRLWEANRKVFLYPENWIEPDLRDDKSPFFAELEDDLLQSDLDDEQAEAALLRYLDKVHEVSRLEVAGTYHEVEDDRPWDNLPPSVNLLHVVARARAQPAVYFYRRHDLNYNTWSPWERIELEIAGDHVIPVVYNRKLHLFWLVFTEKPVQVKRQPPARATSQPSPAPEPPTLLEVQLAWSVRTRDGWTAKKLSHQRIIHPWQRPTWSYNLRPRYRAADNILWLDIFLSASEEFNNRLFYDPYTDQRRHATSFRYDETAQPWHSSSFLFDGQVIETRLRGLVGDYRMDGPGGPGGLVRTDSYRYVHENFGATGRDIQRLRGRPSVAPRLALPVGMHYRNTRFANNTRQVANPSRLNVLESGATVTLLRGAKSPFELVASQHTRQSDIDQSSPSPLVYQDAQRSYFIKPEWLDVLQGSNKVLQQLRYTFYPFSHPYTEMFIRELNRSGLQGLLNRRMQRAPGGTRHRFTDYRPATATVADDTATAGDVDFSFHGAYSVYNWELFFHAPLMIACKLSQNQRFEEALRWFHFIFDPTNTEALGTPQRFWVTKPFFEQNAGDYRRQRIEQLLSDVDVDLDQLRAWKNNPFNPHLIARYRPVAYQKAVVMRYIDNLVAWGDQLFRRDTIESINEATTLYLLASEILGPRPRRVPNIARQDRSFNELVDADGLDPFGNAKVEVLMENLVDSPVWGVAGANGAEPLPRLEVSYFGIPDNTDLLERWKTVAERLFMIRNCMNISGVVRQLPLFEPAIDPALLVRAAAAGVDLGTVLSDAAVPPTQYRFRTMIAKANELCGDVRALGDKLLSVLEKRDAEELALLRSVNEVALLESVEAVRADQVREARAHLATVQESRRTAEEKRDYYTSRDHINAWEGTALALGGTAALAQTGIALGYVLAGGLTLIPKFVAGASGFGGSPHVTAEVIDGYKFSRASEMAVQTLSAIAGAADRLGSLASTMGSYERRQDDWDFQAKLAEVELAQIDKQLLAAEVRVAIAEKEFDNHRLQVEHARATDEYLRSKYTNQQLYGWMLQQVSTVYFQSYQLAFDMAKRAERNFDFELGSTGTTYIRFGYWDGLKKGLLAGERLALDLRRMESAWFERDKRHLQLTKNISLAQMDPLALLRLKQTGACTFTLPEWLFDLDHPGHLRRRVKSVAVTIPCVVGPYTGINATLSLTRSGVRVKDGLTGGYGDPLVGNDERFVRAAVPVESMATSHGLNDAGVFELSFSDERYLPFEGAGAVSEWHLDLPRESNQFDFATISDVVVHLRYEADAGPPSLASAARAQLAGILPAHGVRLFVLNRELATEWQRMLAAAPARDQELVFTVERKHLPFVARHATSVQVQSLHLIVESNHPDRFDVVVRLPGATSPLSKQMPRDPSLAQTHHMETSASGDMLGSWSLMLRKEGVSDYRSLADSDIAEAYLIVGFTTA